jgi:hypothetical protein
MIDGIGKDIAGVECGNCHQEAFRLVPREVTHAIKVCPRCARKIDNDQAEKTAQDALAGMEKAERKRIMRERSLEWASGLNGKKVVVYWDVDKHPVFCTTASEFHALGTAYKTQNSCGGWGQVRIALDESERERVCLQWVYGIKYETGKHKPYQKPVIDGQEFGLYLNLEDGQYVAYISWGWRKCLEVYEPEGVAGARTLS